MILQARAPARIRFTHQQQLGKPLGTPKRIGGFEQLENGVRPQFGSSVYDRMMASTQHRQFPEAVRYSQPFRERLHERNARFLVSEMARPLIRGCKPLAQIVHQHGESHRSRRTDARGVADREHHMDAGVNFGVPPRRLRDTVQCVDLWEDHSQRAAVSQGLKEDIRTRLPEPAFRLLPNALGHKSVDLARGDHIPHQHESLFGYRKAQVGESGSEPGHAENPDGVLHERIRNVPQQSVFQILLAPVGIDDLPRGTFGHRVDRQIAAPEVLFQSDIGRKPRRESPVSGGHFSLEAGEGVFFLCLRMQEDGEFPAHGDVALSFEIVGQRPDHDPVALANRKTEQPVPYRATNQVNFHMRMLSHLRPLLAAVLLACLTGCGTLYLAQAAGGQYHVLRARRPIDKVVTDPKTPAPLRDRLTDVEAARDFAVTELHLPDNHSYRTYADIKRPYVVWNVVATPGFSIEPKHWCFPIAGCVAYRGYFKEKKARAFARSLAAKGYDVMVDGVPAYSTLGKFADPVLSSMMRYGDSELAAIIFHELAHQLLYVKNDTEFNEAFATAVEDAGLERWLKSRGHPDLMREFLTQTADERAFIELFARGREQLRQLYASGIPRQQMSERKAALLAGLTEQARALQRQQGDQFYGSWLDQGLNNAHLASVATYFQCVPGFERLLAEQGGDLDRFYAAARALSKQPRSVRHAQLCQVSR